MTEHRGSGPIGTILPRWVAAAADRDRADLTDAGPGRPGLTRGELVVPVPAAASALARSLDVPAPLLVLAAFVRVVGTLAGETAVMIGYRNGTGPTVPLRVEFTDGSWRELVDMVGRAATGASEQSQAGTRARYDLGFGEVPDTALRVAVDADRLRLGYDRRWLDPDYAGRIGGYLTSALAAMAADPAGPYRSVDLLSAAERHHLVHERCGPVRDLPGARFHQLFAAQAERRPDAVAVVDRDETWSYDRLNRAANQVAHALLDRGLRAEEVVAVAAERGLLWAAAVIGVLKAGGVYLPVDPAYPSARVVNLLVRSRCQLVLTGPGGLDALADQPATRALPVDEVLDAGHRDDEPQVTVGPRQLAYIYFTSGSTGQPKGAMCEHLGMVNHLTAKISDFGIGPDDVVVQNAQASFDISLWQLAAPLMVGARALIVHRDDIVDVRRFLDVVVAGDASILQVVPSYLDVLLRHVETQPRDLGRLRYVSVTGEAITMPLVRRWFATYPRIGLVNAYGATEASDDTTHEVMTAPPAADLVPVGRPVHNVTVYVLTPPGLGPPETLQPLGALGEIAFSGICVGRGYINDPDRTAEAFGADPFRAGERMYRTGDFGRWLPSGSVEFRGRRDEQVKVHGVRIELGEVESRVLEHPLVQAASVVVTPLPGAGKCLVAFYTSSAELSAEQLRGHLTGVLPAAAVPARLHRIAALPLTANGKVDKRLLTSQAQEHATTTGTTARVRPATPTQLRIAHAWAQALNRPIEQIGVDDNFFDLGGSSLSALRVVAGLDGLISLDDLVSSPVLGALAATATGGPGQHSGLLRQLAGPAAGAGRALVCLPYAAGAAINFRPLAAAVADADPAAGGYALQPPGHDLGRPDEPLLGLDELAKLVADEARGLGVKVALWGHCAGAPLALEVARCLGSVAGHVFLAARLPQSAAQLAHEIAAVTAAADDRLAAEIAAQGGLDGLAEAHLGQADLAFIGRVYRHDTRTAGQYLLTAAQRWGGQRLTCPVTVVVSTTDQLTAGYHRRYRAWGAFAEVVRLAEVDGGGHYFPRTRPEQAASVVLGARW